MKWIIDNWTLLVVIGAALIVVFIWFKRFTNLPSEEQQEKIKQWLLYAVISAEREYKSGTGRLKLAYVWSLFLDKYPSLAPVVPFEVFSKWVDEVLVQMRRLLEENKDIEEYVKGDENGK